MRVISIINLKGGVGKTVSAINIAHILAANYKARVLLIDNDKQGNASKFFELHSYDLPSVADVLTGRAMPIAEVVRHSQYDRLDLVPANMGLLTANSSLLVDTSRTRDYRMRSSLEAVADHYDWCVIDNAPDINISVINALMASDDVLIPVKIDRFAFDGLQELVEQIDDIRTSNDRLRLAGCFFTMYQRNRVSREGDDWMRQEQPDPVFETQIRNTVKVTETTYAGRPLLDYSPNCTASKDYLRLVAEYLEGRDCAWQNSVFGT